MKQRHSSPAFTLVELLAALAVLAMLMVVVFGVFNQASKAWMLAENRTETFSGARMALDMIGRDLEGAIVGVHTNSSGTITSVQLMTYDGTGFYPPSFPNNTGIFFATQNSDSRTYANYIDLAECGYYVVPGSSGSGMQSGHYYLMRHYVKSSDPNFTLFSAPAQQWWLSLQPGNETPMLDNVLRFLVYYESTAGASPPYGTAESGTWSSPSTTLPRAFNLRLSLIDRRYAARLAITGLTSGSGGDIQKIPDNIGSSFSSPATAQTVREGVRTFYRSIYPRGGS